MQPIFFTVGAHLPLMIIPQNQADLYDYPVMTFTYQIYRVHYDCSAGQIEIKQTDAHTKKFRDAVFLGYIVFEFPEKDYNYIEQGSAILNADEVHDTIAQIALYRKSYGVWEV